MKPLKVLSKFENHFASKTVYFQVSLDMYPLILDTQYWGYFYEIQL